MHQLKTLSIPGSGSALPVIFLGVWGAGGCQCEEVNGRPLTPRSAESVIPADPVRIECSRKVSFVTVLHVSCMFLNIHPFNWDKIRLQ